jgi:hypothetical protein
MLLPTMTFEEIRKEIEKDYPILLRKMDYVAHDIRKKMGKDARKKGIVRYFDYYSKYKNHWIYKLYISKEEPEGAAMLLYHNGKGHAGILLTNKMQLIYHTGHFFERYNERARLGLKTLNDIIRSYMDENTDFQSREIEEIAPGIFKIFCVIPSGIILGMLNKPLMLLKANTFLSNDMLSKNQIELKAQILNVLEKYKHTSGNLN